MTPARRRPNSIGADDARSWARKIRLGNPYAKAILMALANYMNEDGTAYPGIDTIASDTDINPDTVLRRERWLEDIGAIVLSKCWVDENGRRNKEGRGRPTSTEIRFLFDADIEEIEAAALSDEPKALRGAAKKSHEERGASYRPHGEQNSIQEQPVSTSLAPQQPPTGRTRHIEENLEREVPPQPPLAGGAFNEDSEKRFQEFKSSYPDGIVDPEAAKREFAALTEPDQIACVAAVPVYAGRCRKRREKSLKAHLFVRKRSWDGLLATSTDVAAPQLYEPKSPAAKALRTLGAMARYTPLTMADGRLSHRGEITPRLLAMAEIDAETKFAIYKMGSPNFRAWWTFIREVFEGCNLPARMELSTPWPWPPKADGSIYSGSDPPPLVPGTLATDEDLQEMDITARG